MSSACYSRTIRALIESNDLRAQCNRRVEIPRVGELRRPPALSIPRYFFCPLFSPSSPRKRTRNKRHSEIEEDSTPNRNVIIKDPFILSINRFYVQRYMCLKSHKICRVILALSIH